MINLGSVSIKGVKCSDHGKKIGDTWETYGPTIDATCSGMCYVGKESRAKRATKWNWHCDIYGHIIPGSTKYVADSTRVKRVLIDGLIRKQTLKPEKYVGAACEKSTRERVEEIRCDITQKEMLTCPESFPIEVTQAERDTIDDMSYGLSVASCNEVSLYQGSNKCGEKGTKFLSCFKQCRTKCEADTSNVAEDYEILDYYPRAVRTDTIQKK